MTQNIYDDAEFFEGYSRLERSLQGLEGAAEWPVLKTLLPDLHGLTVADLGCGYGWFCRWARAQGAARVLGFDMSEKMLARAGAMTSDDAVAYQRADLETLRLPAGSFDLVYSSLALHYVEDIAGLLGTVRDALRTAGHLVFSVEHPIYTAPAQPGWSTTPDGRKVWPVDSYLDEGRRVVSWLGAAVVKQHRTIAAYLNLLIGLGFAISRVEEWGPSPEQVAARPDWAEERHRPMFLLMSARCPG